MNLHMSDEKPISIYKLLMLSSGILRGSIALITSIVGLLLVFLIPQLIYPYYYIGITLIILCNVPLLHVILSDNKYYANKIFLKLNNEEIWKSSEDAHPEPKKLIATEKSELPVDKNGVLCYSIKQKSLTETERESAISDIEKTTIEQLERASMNDTTRILFRLGLFIAILLEFSFIINPSIVGGIIFVFYCIPVSYFYWSNQKHIEPTVFLKFNNGEIQKSPRGRKFKKDNLRPTELTELPLHRRFAVFYIITKSPPPSKSDKKKSSADNSSNIDMYNLSPREFEKYIAESVKEDGFQSRVTKKGGDRGIDVIARKNNAKVVIQAKRYSKGNKVSRPTVQKTLAAGLSQNADKVVIVTTSSFTEPAKREAQNLSSEIPIELQTV